MPDVSDLKQGERTLRFPTRPAPAMPTLPGLRPRRGSFVAAIDPPPETTDGGIVLPNTGNGFTTRMGAAGVMRSDSAVVLAAGAGVPLSPGERVVVAPYSGHRWLALEGVDGFSVFGCKDDDWLDVTQCVWRGGRWELLGNWLAIAIDVREETILTNGYPLWDYTGTVVQVGPDATLPVGTRVVVNKDIAQVRPDDTRWFVTEDGPFSARTVLVREVDSFGTGRIEAIIEED